MLWRLVLLQAAFQVWWFSQLHFRAQDTFIMNHNIKICYIQSKNLTMNECNPYHIAPRRALTKCHKPIFSMIESMIHHFFQCNFEEILFGAPAPTEIFKKNQKLLLFINDQTSSAWEWRKQTILKHLHKEQQLSGWIY